jgi:NADPH:quinone reductase
MRAIVIDGFGSVEHLVIKEIPEPEPKPGHAVIKVMAFGINHAEMHMRRGEWAEAAPVSGIECVGIVKSCPGGEFKVGTKVAALMGGLGRTINGSYAEYTRARVENVASIESDLPWEDLAAIPESTLRRGRVSSATSNSRRVRHWSFAEQCHHLGKQL